MQQLDDQGWPCSDEEATNSELWMFLGITKAVREFDNIRVNWKSRLLKINVILPAKMLKSWLIVHSLDPLLPNFLSMLCMLLLHCSARVPRLYK